MSASVTPCFENFAGFTNKNWKPLDSFEQALEQPAGSWITYTRDSYLSPAEFKKMSDDAKTQGLDRVQKKRKKVTGIVREVDHENKVLTVESIPRRFRNEAREMKVLSWKLREHMKGNPLYYAQIPMSEEEIAQRKKERSERASAARKKRKTSSSPRAEA